MSGRRIFLAAFLTMLAALSPAWGTSEHQYAKNEYAVVRDGRAPNGRLSLASHGEGEMGDGNFHVYLMAEPGHRRLATLEDISGKNNLDTAPDAYHAAWSPDSRHVAVTFRSNRHIVTLNLYAIAGGKARLIEAPDLFRTVTGRAVDPDADPRTVVPGIEWQGPRRFRIRDYRLFVENDAKLADRLGAFAKTTRMKDGRFTIQFSAEANCELAGNRHRIARPQPGEFPNLDD